jgi:hypothetical protein
MVRIRIRNNRITNTDLGGFLIRNSTGSGSTTLSETVLKSNVLPLPLINLLCIDLVVECVLPVLDLLGPPVQDQGVLL